jgi:hypothetical protein
MGNRRSILPGALLQALSQFEQNGMIFSGVEAIRAPFCAPALGMNEYDDAPCRGYSSTPGQTAHEIGRSGAA